MIIPYGHEHTSVRRLPWVTFTIMGLCVLAFVATNVVGGANDAEVRALERFYEVFEYLAAHPYLELSPRMDELLRERLSDQEYELLTSQLVAMRGVVQDARPSDRQVSYEQKHLDELVEDVFEAIAEVEDNPLFRWGMVPANLRAETLFTYQFLHGGWMHLIGNLLFLFLAGPFIEDVWGRPLFGTFYIVAGIVSALMFAVHYPRLEGPLIGASGAVAGVMGAFLIRYWNTKIKFFYWLFFVFSGTFMAPAWLMLPLWFARELLFAQAWDVISPGAGGGGVAHWAHVWGFGFGLVVAGAIKYYGVEERFIHEAIESKITLVDNTAVEQAMEASGQGRPDEAIQLLSSELRSHPENIDAAVAFWNLALARGSTQLAASHLLRAIRHALRTEDPTLVLNHWHELLENHPELTVELPLAARVAEILHEHGRHGDLDVTLGLAARQIRPETAPGVLTRLARIGGAAHSPSAAAFVQAAIAHPETPPDIRSELEAVAEVLPPGPAAVENESSDVVEPVEQEERVAEAPAVQHTLQVMEAVPTALADGRLTIQVQGATRRLTLDQIQAVGVAGVRRDDQRPFLVVDLLLDPPWSDRTQLRVLRLLSTAFDPRVVVGGSDATQAFRNLVGEILRISEAVPLPDPNSAMGNPFRTYPSLAAYQIQVLGVSEESSIRAPQSVPQ